MNKRDLSAKLLQSGAGFDGTGSYKALEGADLIWLFCYWEKKQQTTPSTHLAPLHFTASMQSQGRREAVCMYPGDPAQVTQLHVGLL